MTRVAVSSVSSPLRRRRRAGRAASTGPSSASASSTSATSASVHATRAMSGSRRRCSSSLLVLGEDAVGRRADEGAEAEQVVDELGARRARATCARALPSLRAGARRRARSSCSQPSGGASPRASVLAIVHVESLVAVEQARDVVGRGAASDVAAFAVRADRGGLVARDEQVEDAPHDVRPAFVVRSAAAGASPSIDADGVAAARGAAATRRCSNTRSCASGRSRSATACAMTWAMRASPLSAATSAPVGCRDAQARLQPGDRRELHVLFAERRQHVLDVAQEHRARTDEQHALRTRAGAGACRAGTRRGAARPRSCRCRARPRRRARRAGRRGSPRPARPGSWRRCRPCGRCGCVRARRAARPRPRPAGRRFRRRSWSNTSSSRPMTSRPLRVMRWRRRTTPIGATAVAR